MALHVLVWVTLLIVTLCQGTSLWEKSCAQDCICTVEPWPYIQLDAKVARCENRSLDTVPRNLTAETEVLLLRYNHLGAELNIHDFRYLQSMRFLDLSHNGIRVIHALGLVFPEVRYLNLSHNNIRNIPAEVLADFTALESLHLDNNHIGSLSKATFSLPRLQYLNLAYNRIYAFKPDFYFNTLLLATLILSHNSVTRLSGNIFFRTPSLAHLDLSHNRLSKLEDLVFDGLRSLGELNLEGNSLRTVPATAIKAVSSIGSLVLDGNPIRQLDADSFRGLNITRISLCHMDELGVVGENTFAGMTHLTSVELHSNRALNSISPNSFVALPHLQSVDLRDNNLYVVEEHIRSLEKDAGTFEDAPLVIRLAGNPLICDCNLKWVQNILLRQYNQNVTVPEIVKCIDRQKNTAAELMELDELPSQCPPFVLPLFHPIVKETVASDTSFICHGVGIPTPDVRWVLPDGKALTTDHCEDRVCVSGHTLFISTLHEQDSGVYECHAQNHLGQFKRSLHLQVDNVNVVLFPLTVTSTFVTLTWNSSGLLLPPTKFLLQYSRQPQLSEQLKVIEIGTKIHSYTIGGLAPGETYTFWLCIKRSDYAIKVSSVAVKTKGEGFLPMFGIRKNYASMVMIATAFGAFFLGCAVVCCVRVCRWARKGHSEMVAADDYFVKSDSCNSEVAFMTYINISDDSTLIDHEDESPQ